MNAQASALMGDGQRAGHLAHRRDGAVSITTKGTVLRHEQLDAIACLPRVHLIVSVDGPSGAVHDVVRGRCGAFETSRTFVAEARRRGIPILINMTVSEKNYKYVIRPLSSRVFGVPLILA
jgi:MoaA/NifB/PqqE/SkfB family radical SAM enzyme